MTDLITKLKALLSTHLGTCYECGTHDFDDILPDLLEAYELMKRELVIYGSGGKYDYGADKALAQVEEIERRAMEKTTCP